MRILKQTRGRQADASAVSSICASCSAQVAHGERFCRACGTPIVPITQASTTESPSLAAPESSGSATALREDTGLVTTASHEPTPEQKAKAAAIRSRRSRVRRLVGGAVGLLMLTAFIAVSWVYLPPLGALDTATRFLQASEDGSGDSGYQLLDKDTAERLPQATYDAWMIASGHWLAEAGWGRADLRTARFSYRFDEGAGLIIDIDGERAFCPVEIAGNTDKATVEIVLDEGHRADDVTIMVRLRRSTLAWRVVGATVAGHRLFESEGAR